MEKKIVGYVPRLLYKIYLFLKEKFDNTPPTPEEVKFGLDICAKMFLDENTNLTFSPLSGKRIAKNDIFDIYIVLEGRTVNIINQSYSYNIFVEENDLFNSLIKKFDNTLEEQRKNMELEIRDNMQYSLKNILDKINTVQ